MNAGGLVLSRIFAEVVEIIGPGMCFRIELLALHLDYARDIAVCTAVRISDQGGVLASLAGGCVDVSASSDGDTRRLFDLDQFNLHLEVHLWPRFPADSRFTVVFHKASILGRTASLSKAQRFGCDG